MEKFYFISDVHVIEDDDDQSILLQDFFKHALTHQASKVFLLGDIFDAMIGNYPEYIQKYQKVFDAIEELLESQVEVFFFEGNHDFHLKRMFEYFLIKKSLDKNLFHYVKGAMLISTPSGKTAYLSHGDDIEIENHGYQAYKVLVNNRFVDLLTDQIFSYKFTENLSEKASQASRERNKLRYDGPESQAYIRDKFRRSVEILSQKIDSEYIILGHSHFKDHYKTTNGKIYLNNGLALKSQSFLLLDETGHHFIEL